MNEESRPQAASQTPAEVSSDSVPATHDNNGEAVLFDVVTESTGFGTTVSVEIARSLRDHAVADASRNSDAFWSSTALQGIRELALSGHVFQAADLVELGVPEPPNSSQWGAIMARAHRLGIIAHAGYGPSRRASVHGSVCARWIGATP
jgi:hypothetical protein